MTKIVPDGEGPDNLKPLAEQLLAELPVLLVRPHPSVRLESMDGSAVRWSDECGIFAVEHERVEYVSTFQFRVGRPRPTICTVLLAFPPEVTAWDQAYWFVSADRGLGGRQPCEALDDVDALVTSARLVGAEMVQRWQQAAHMQSLHGRARA
ncbi:hypothetical protein [Muricoccus aerilatus]|uniref:hypothetical protein n=1 Tax=Muricoccus aerilatus TaxID=452982 RepID=UPI0005C1B0AB|nr:hypothetical protein [Roseomonas aerilata]